ncbi:MAG: efflux transporter outer membrane subunit [Deltaproteobacteria bacterium]|nr:efflux transporter outer membrane subunit [Deltaproteobacteria bacterium]
MNTHKTTLLLVCGFFLGACAVGPDYQRPQVSLPNQWHNLQQDSAPKIKQTSKSDLNKWWQLFNDSLLNQLIEQALNDNLDLQQAKARLQQARASRLAAIVELLPQASVSTSAARRYSRANATLGSTTNQYSASFDASWEMDIFGGARRSVEAVTADQESFDAALDNTRISLCAEVARTYYEIRSLKLRVDIARKNLETQNQTLQLTKFRAEAGLVNTQDVEQATSNVEQTRAQLPTLEIQLLEAEHSLDLLLGQNPGTLHKQLHTATELPEIPNQIAVGIPADSLRQRPDIKIAERNLAAATARVGIATAALYPSLKLSGSIGVEALTLSGLGNSDGFFYSLIGGITAPLFHGGRLRAQVKVQDAIREQALLTYKQTILNALQEVENTLVALVRNTQKAETLTRAVTAAQNASNLAWQRYKAGVIDFQAVLNTERSLLSLEDNLASARIEKILTLIRLYKALGGGWREKEST